MGKDHRAHADDIFPKGVQHDLWPRHIGGMHQVPQCFSRRPAKRFADKGESASENNDLRMEQVCNMREGEAHVAAPLLQYRRGMRVPALDGLPKRPRAAA